MSEELGKIEKPSTEEFKGGRKLYFVPLVYCGKEPPDEYLEKYSRYWEQVESQIADLELKLGKINKVYHELISLGGEGGAKLIKSLNDRSYQTVKNRLDKGAKLEATEDGGILAEFMDWSVCLAMGLQSPTVVNKIYQFYVDASNKRNEHIAKHIDETLESDEIAVIFMVEGHLVQFPSDIQVFYVAPPALDEIKRWLRNREAKKPEESTLETVEKKEGE